jgi:hypothetical protein
MIKRAPLKAASSPAEFRRGAGVDRARLAQALPQLPDTADELNAFANDFGVAADDIYLVSDGSETTLRRTRLSDHAIVYFATHGLVFGDIKGLAEPSLALSIAAQPTELDDGLLTASEVAQLKPPGHAGLISTMPHHRAMPIRPSGDLSP